MTEPFDPARDNDNAEIIATYAFHRAMKGDGIAALMAAGVTARRKLKGERDTEFIKRIGRAYLSACHTLCIIDGLSVIARASDTDRSAKRPDSTKIEAGPEGREPGPECNEGIAQKDLGITEYNSTGYGNGSVRR